jgi:SAM-dependent methyltransferase
MPHERESALTTAILAKLQSAGKDLTALTPHDLAPVDQFHNGGTWATRKLLALAAVPPGARVLDVGGGIGGPARTLATEFDVKVTVVDRSPAFCRTGAELTAQLGLGERVDFVVGSGARLPLRSASVDAVLQQNAAMNIADKEGLTSEIFRILRPGGRFAFQEVMDGPVASLRFPTPWAVDPTESFTRQPDDARRMLAAAGFIEITWLDASDLIRSWVHARIGRSPGTPPIPPLTSFMMPPETCEAAIANMWRNDEERRTVTIWAVLEKPGRSAGVSA